MMKLILVALYLVLFLVLTIPVLFAEWIIGKCNPACKDRSSKAIVGWGFRCIQHIAGVKLIVKGTEHIPTDTAVLYVGNHRSFFDVVLTLSCFPTVTGYVSKIEMRKVPLLNLWMKNIHCLFLDRDNIKEGLKTILAAVEEVKKGISLCIFPEGTRNRQNDTFLPFHEGSFKIAEKGGVPIIPMTIVNSAAVFEDHFPKVKKATVVIEFGAPVSMKDMSRDEKKAISSTVKGIIEETYFKNKKEYFPEAGQS